MLHRFVLSWLPFRWVVVFGLLTAAITNLAAEEATKDQQIADIEKQIKELSKKLDELRRENVKPATTPDGTISADWVKSMNWRCIGPASMGGRIVAFSVFEADPSTYWVATSSGGLLKTINNGITFTHQFDRESTVSIGDVCVAPSDRNIVWVGTGENNPRNSVSYGDGVYKSTDGGATWKSMGLNKTFQIGKIIVHPKNPDIVYVGALGRLYGANAERGLFKTTDGGKSWNRMLFVDEKTGVIDMQMNPSDTESLIVAMWERRRDEFDSHRGEPALQDGYDAYDPITKWGPGSGLYKTSDGGKSFKKLTRGLPTNSMGRIGIDFYRKTPNTVYAIIDCEKIGKGVPPSTTYLGIQGENGDGGAKLTQITADSPASKAGLKAGDVIKAVDKKEIAGYEPLAELIRTHKAGDKLNLSLIREGKPMEIVVTLASRTADPTARVGGGGQGRFAAGSLLGALGEDAEGGGAHVTRLIPESAAAKAGIKEGDVIKSLGGKEIKTYQQVVDILREHKAGDKLKLTVVQENEPKELEVTLAAVTLGGGSGPRSATPTRPYSFAYGGQRENVQDQQGPNSFEYGGIYKSTDGGESWTRINSLNPRPMYFSVIRVDPSDEKYLYVGGISLYRSTDGGKTFKDDGGNGVHPDQHALWVDPKDGRHMLVGCDGGFYLTYDRMDHWDHLNHLAIGQFYHVAVDNKRPYHVYGGLQDNGSWGGPSHTLGGTGPINEDWIVVSGGDGFVCRVDPNEPDLVYFESQDGAMGRRNLRTGERGFIRPRTQPGSTAYRFNWNTPFILSNHNPRIFYCGGNFVFRSLKQGDELRVISPEITRTKRGTATAIAESPRNPDVLYAGTDDGYLWVTKDGGTKWTNISDRVGLPGPRWISTIEPSRFVEGRAYVTFDAHRSDDDEPYVYVTEDFGQTWKPLRANLPLGSTRVLREDVKNPNLLFVGTEFAVWVSLNRGASWVKLNNNLPTVAVHEFAIHPTAGEMVAATHGRSLWVLDINPLRQMTTDVMKAGAHLYEPTTAVRWRSDPQRGSPYGNGSRKYFGENPPRGAQIYYSLTKKADKVSVKIVDFAGKTVRELQQPKKDAGLHRITWDLSRASTGGGPGGGQRRGGPGGGGPGGGQPATPGMYRVVLNVDGQELTQAIRVEADPSLPTNLIAEDRAEDEDGDDEDEEERERREMKKYKEDDD